MHAKGFTHLLIAAPPSGPVNTVAPVIAGTVNVGSSVAVTPGTWTGSPTLTYSLYRGGVIDGTEVGRTEAQAEAYVFVAADIGPTIVWREIANGVPANFADSNTLQFTDLASLSPTFLVDERGQVGSPISPWNDQSGNGRNLTQVTAAFRPTTGGTINGFAAPTVDGTQQYMNGPAATGGNAYTTSTASRIFVVLDNTGTTPGPNGGSAYFEPCVFALSDDAAGWIGLAWSIGGPRAYGTDVTNVFATPRMSATLGAHVIDVKHDGATLSAQRNADAPATVALGTLVQPGSLTYWMSDFIAADFYVGRVGLIFTKGAMTANEAATARAFITYKYGVPT